MHNFKTIKKCVKTNSGVIFYFINAFYDNNKPTAILLHGLSANHSTWRKTFDKLTQAGYRVVAPDLRGHGLSDKRRIKSLYRLENIALDLELIKEAEKISQFIIVGYSFGGAVALEFALNYQQGLMGLIMISTNYQNPLGYRGFKKATWMLLILLSVAARLLIWQKRNRYLYYQPNIVRGYWSSTYSGLKTMPVSVNIWLLSEMLKLSFSGRLEQIKIPVTIVYSRNDPFLTEEELVAMLKDLPQAKLIPSTNGNHFIASGAQDETANIILDFIKSI